jgi:hypothetical protein
MMDTMDPIVDKYLEDLRRELQDVPRSTADEVVAEVRAHLAEALPDHHSEADVRNAIDRLGDPADIAAEVKERSRSGSQRPRRRRIVAVATIVVAVVAVGTFVLLRPEPPYDFRGAVDYVGTTQRQCAQLTSAPVTAVVTSTGEETGRGPATFEWTSGQCWLVWRFPLDRMAAYQLAILGSSIANPGPSFTADELESADGQLTFRLSQFPSGISL